MTEHHPAIGRHEVFAVVLDDRRSGALVIEHQDLGREPFAVKPIANRRCARTGNHDPKGVDLLAARQRQHCQRRQAEQRHRNPKQLFPETHTRKLPEKSHGCHSLGSSVVAGVPPAIKLDQLAQPHLGISTHQIP